MNTKDSLTPMLLSGLWEIALRDKSRCIIALKSPQSSLRTFAFCRVSTVEVLAGPLVTSFLLYENTFLSIF